ncbi:protein AF-10 isoform X4 [Latimeria chalumnae]|uniref:protein AF-10 isoform X4 n=1 Tax=Latimeria chalumnae TaxID=7897 RepID=UPI00313F2E0E
MVSSDPAVAVEDDLSNNMKEMIGGCCVCSDERGWAENPLVYCDGHGCNVAVHQACYGIVQVPTGPWFCRKCESQERAARVRCELCPHKDGALKRTDNGGWAHVVCALYIPEVQFANVSTMEPIVFQSVPHDRFNKKKTKRGSNTAYDPSLSDSSSHSQDKHHDKDKKKHKERDKHKQKHKKQTDSSLSLVPSLTVTTEKTYTSTSNSSMSGSLKQLEETTARFTNANFQEVSAQSSTGKEGSEVKGQEVKGKKSGGHNTGQRGRKPGGGKTPVITVPATSPFQQGSLLGTPSSVKSPSGSSVQSPPEFLGCTEPDLRNDSYIHSQQSATTSDMPKRETLSQEGSVTGFTSLMGLPSSSAGTSNPKNYENSHGDFSNSSLNSATYKRPQPSGMEEDTVKEKKRKGNKRSKHGPGRPRGSKAQENISHLSLSSASPTSSVASATGSITSSNLQKSPTLLRNGSLQSLSVGSSPVGSGAYASNDVPVPFPNAVSGSSCSTPLSSSHIPQQPTAHLPQIGASTPPATTSVTTVSTTQANALPGSTFSLAASHMYGNRLNPNSAMAALIAQSESNQTDQDVGDNSRNLPGRGSSPRGSLSPRSPVSSLQIRYDHSSNSGLENLPPVASSIEQLLERQWSEGQQFLLEQGTSGDILGMLKSLHQLQVENQRLEEQIKNLTAKKERLQLLNAQLSVPFPTITSNPNPSSHIHPLAAHFVPSTDSLNSSKSPHLSSSCLPENSLPIPAQDLTSSGQSNSSSSALSTPPPAGQSPAQQGSGVAGVQQVNGVTVGALSSGMQTATSTIPAMPGVGGLIGTLPGNQLAINGIVGALNGVIHTPVSVAQTHSPLSHTAVPPNVTLPLSSTLSNSVSGLALLPDQQRQLLFHQQQQQLHQLLASQQLTTEQHQALLYQLVQHHHHQHQPELQQLQVPGTQIPMNNLLASAQAPPLHTTANPFLAIHGDHTTQKVARLNDKTGPVAQEKS